MPIAIPDFIPASFNEAFYGTSTINQEDKKSLFHHLFFDKDSTPMDCLLASILQGSTEHDYGFLASSCVGNGKNYHYRNKRIVYYLIDYLTQNNAEQFFMFIYRVNSLWKDEKNAKSTVMKDNLKKLFDKNRAGKSIFDKCMKYFVDPHDEIYDVYIFFSCIDILYGLKPSYAYALIVLWTILNSQVIYLLPAIKNIIIYKDNPSAYYEPDKRYIIKSALNENLFLSVQKTNEPLSDGEGFHNEREILFYVNFGKFHVPTSIFRIVKCSILDQYQGELLNKNTEEESLINEEEVAKLLNKSQKYLKPNVPDLVSRILPQKTEPYYIQVGEKFLTYGSWFSQTRVVLKEQRENRSKWSFTNSPSIVSIFNRGQIIDMFALDIPNGTQTIPSLMWCFFSFSQAAQRFSIHEVINWWDIHEKKYK